MNNLTSLFPPNYKNLEQPAAIKLLEDIYTAAEEQDKTKLENGTLVELPCKVTKNKMEQILNICSDNS